MTETQWSAIWRIMCALWPGSAAAKNPESAVAYRIMLIQCDHDAIRDAVRAHAEVSSWFPSVAQIRAHAGLTRSPQTAAEAAWEDICYELDRGALDLPQDEQAAAALLAIGGIVRAKVSSVSERGFLGREFVAAWMRHRDAERQGGTPPSLREARRVLAMPAQRQLEAHDDDTPADPERARSHIEEIKKSMGWR